MSDFDNQLNKMTNGRGFIAALDQSGGSSPKALKDYGIDESAYANDEEMFGLIHQMRARMISNSSFRGDRILGAILFEMTMDRQVEGQPTASYLWEKKEIVPFLKVDQGLEEEKDGVQLMKPMTKLTGLLERAKTHPIFGTKMRSVIQRANPHGVRDIVAQQFEYARQIIAAGLVPIIEPEINIHSPEKQEAEDLLQNEVLKELNKLAPDQRVMLKVSIPTVPNHYRPCQEHPRMVRVVALSGGYDRLEANAMLAKNHGMIASFSRALLAGLEADQSDADFTATLNRTIEGIYEASIT